MTKTWEVTLGSWILISALTCVLVSEAFTAQAAEVVPGEILVKYRTSAVRNRTAMNSFYRANGVNNVFRFTGSAAGLERVTFDPTLSVEDALKKVMQDPLVEYAHPNLVFGALPMSVGRKRLAETPCTSLTDCAFSALGSGWPSKPKPTPTPTTGPLPDRRPPVASAPSAISTPIEDPNAAKLYGMQKIGAVRAQAEARGGATILVADIDSGVDYNHEDLAANLYRGGTGTKGDQVGYDFTHHDEYPYDDTVTLKEGAGHGTHTAGTIAAVAGNGLGVFGVAPNVRLMALKFLDSKLHGTMADAISAIDYAVDHGAKVLNNSWGESCRT